MAISWVTDSGKTGIAEDSYEFAMQHSVNSSAKGNREELSPQERINQAFGEGPTPELKDQNAPYSWGMGEDLKDLGTTPDASDADWNKAYGTKRAGEFIPIQAKPSVATDQTTYEQIRDMLHDLRVKFMGDPEKWSTKEEVGNFINQAMSVMGGGYRGPKATVVPRTVATTAQEALAKYETLSSQGKTTKQIVKATKLDPEVVRDQLGRDNLAIAAFNSENALTSAYFKSLEGLDPALSQALKNQVSVKDLKRYTRNLPEERLKTIFEELPISVKESFQSGEARRAAIDAGKKTKIIAKPLNK